MSAGQVSTCYHFYHSSYKQKYTHYTWVIVLYYTSNILDDLDSTQVFMKDIYRRENKQKCFTPYICRKFEIIIIDYKARITAKTQKRGDGVHK